MPRDYTGRELSHAGDFILIMKLIHNPFQYADAFGGWVCYHIFYGVFL